MRATTGTILAFRVFCVLVLLFLYAPIAANFVFSFNSDRFPSLPLGELTLDWYKIALSNEQLSTAFRNTVVVGFLSAPIATLLGFASAYADYRFNFIGKRLILVIVLLPPLVPLVVIGLAMLAYFSRIGLSGTLPAVIVAHIALTAPLAMAIIRLRFAQVDTQLELAAQNLGATNWRAFYEVILPSTKASVGAAALLCIAVSFDEYAVTWFVGGFQETVAVRVLGYLQSAVSPSINAIGSITFAVSMSLIVYAQFLLLRRLAEDKQ